MPGIAAIIASSFLWHGIAIRYTQNIIADWPISYISLSSTLGLSLPFAITLNKQRGK
jgi:hypothetical protein